MKGAILEYDGSLDYGSIKRSLRYFDSGNSMRSAQDEFEDLSVEKFISQLSEELL
jgi:hypothetical protein